jgi:uncharacterized membrane protein
MPSDDTNALICPACGGVNDAHAVFCKNPACHKALGEFRYALEELGKQSRWHVAMVSKIAAFIGRPHFVVAHIVWVGLWIAFNTGLIIVGHAFDAYPFGLLALVLSIEAVLITSILIISNSGQSDLANTRASLDYEVNVQTYREIMEISRSLERKNERLDQLEGRSSGQG